MRIIVDSGFWFGFMDKSDGYHKQAEEIFEKISVHNPVFLIPYVRVCDSDYREKAFMDTVSDNPRGLSFVDNIIREMMCDKTQKIDALITFNTGDFIDICSKEGICIFDGGFNG